MAEEKKGFKSEKKLKCTAVASAYQKNYFFELKERVAKGEKCGYLNADVPMEIFRAMDIPFVVNQWWTALSAAKQMNAQYFDLLKENGYRGDICTYCAGALGASMLPDMDTAPWGGLPKISFAVTRLTCDCQMKIFDLLAKQYGAKFYAMENTTPLSYDLKWYERVQHDWDKVLEPDRLDAMVDDLKGLIEFLENETGKKFDMQKFIDMMNLINEQEMWFEKSRQLLLNCDFSTVSQADLSAAILIPQWHRGTEWARDQAKALYEELKERIDQGKKQIPNEKIRMMSLGRGLWFNQGFFQYFEEKYGLVFPGISHLTFASQVYTRFDVEKDPLRALASRYGGMEDFIHTPPFNSVYNVQNCIDERIDGVVYFVSSNCMLAVDGSEFQIRELERAGIPVLAIRLDPINAKAWNQEKMIAVMEDFINNRVLPNKERKGKKTMTGSKPLEGIKVLDFTSFVSGTTCTQQLAWLGADVIKVERPLPKDSGNGKPKASVRFDYQMLNMNKKSITCNAKTPEGLELLKKLVKECDVLVENMNPGAIQRMGLDYETCKAINPGIIFTQIKGFAEDGPFGKYPAFNSVAVAMGGFASGLGMPGGEPIVNGPADQISGIYAAYGILAAILQRNKTGLGQKVFISMQEVMMFLSFQNFLQYANNGKVPERSGNLMAGVKTAPHNIYKCAPCGENDYVQIYCSRHPGSTEFEELCRVIGREDIIGTEKFKTPESRFENREELDAIIEGWTSRYSKYEVMEKMALAGVPCGAVLDVADLAGDEYLRKSGAMIELGEGSEKAYQPGFTPRMSEFKPDYKNAPHVGDSNSEVYGRILGLSETEIADLQSKGVI